MKTDKDFEDFKNLIKPDLIEIIKMVKTQISDDCADPDCEDLPNIQVTISTNENLKDWHYQTGDNSYTGGCYCDPYWGVDYVYEDSDPEEVANSLIEDLFAQFDFAQFDVY